MTYTTVMAIFHLPILTY